MWLFRKPVRHDFKPPPRPQGVVDVEVDRCIDENSASNHGWVALLSPSFTEAPSIETQTRPKPDSCEPHPKFPQGGTFHQASAEET